MAARTTATTWSPVAPGVSTPATPASSSFGDVDVGHDAADDDGDVGAALAHLVDHERRQRHVRARQHRQPDGVDVLVDRRRGDRVRRLEQPGVDHLEAGVAQDAATTLTPRSWPSRPTLATRRRSPVRAPGFVERRCGLAALARLDPGSVRPSRTSVSASCSRRSRGRPCGRAARPRPCATASAAVRTAAP